MLQVRYLQYVCSYVFLNQARASLWMVRPWPPRIALSMNVSMHVCAEIIEAQLYYLWFVCVSAPKAIINN